MKHIGILALTFILGACLMTGCGNKNTDGGTTNAPSTTPTTATQPTTKPTEATTPTTTPTEDTTADTNPTDATGGEGKGFRDGMPRSPIPGMSR